MGVIFADDASRRYSWPIAVDDQLVKALYPDSFVPLLPILGQFTARNVLEQRLKHHSRLYTVDFPSIAINRYIHMAKNATYASLLAHDKGHRFLFSAAPTRVHSWHSELIGYWQEHMQMALSKAIWLHADFGFTELQTAIKAGCNEAELLAEILFLAQNSNTQEIEDDMSRYMERNGHYTALYWLTIIFIAEHPDIDCESIKTSSQEAAQKIAQGICCFEAIKQDIENDVPLVQALKLMLYDAALRSQCELSLDQWSTVNSYIDQCVVKGLALQFTKVSAKLVVGVDDIEHPWQVLDQITVDASWRNSCYLDLKDLKRFPMPNEVGQKDLNQLPPPKVQGTPFWRSLLGPNPIPGNKNREYKSTFS